MITVTNISPSPAVVNGYTVPPGSWAVPGPQSLVFVDSLGVMTTESPDYVLSFGSGFVLVAPFLTVILVRKCLRLFSSATLDRF
jgi:hypothetical protein